MSAKTFSAVAALVFLVAAVAQGYRALNAIPVHFGTFDVPVMVSWIACGVLIFLGLLGLRAASR